MTRDGAQHDPGNGRDEADGVDRPHADAEGAKDDFRSSPPDPHADAEREKEDIRSSPPEPPARELGNTPVKDTIDRHDREDSAAHDRPGAPARASAPASSRVEPTAEVDGDAALAGNQEDRERDEDPDPGITPHIDGSTSPIPGCAELPPASPFRTPSERIATIALRDVTFAYGDGPPVLDGVSVEIVPGLTLLVGPNGCGKSTFMRLAAGVEFPEEGRVLVEGLDLWKDEARARLQLAYVPEQPDLTPYASIREVLKLVARLRGEPLAVVDRMLEITGLSRLGRRSVRALSLGQRRRVLLAAAMIGRPSVLLLDEPLEAMDRSMRELIVAWVLERCMEGATAIVATHEFEGFERAAERVITIEEGVATMVDPLPSEPDERRAVIERLARGRAGAAPVPKESPSVAPLDGPSGANSKIEADHEDPAESPDRPQPERLGEEGFEVERLEAEEPEPEEPGR